MRLLERLPILLLASAAAAACAPSRPPFTQAPSVGAQTDPRQASLVFLWPEASCDPAGYFTLATADGKFIGTISRGSKLSVSVPAGESTIVGWNEVVERVGGATNNATVPVLHANLREGGTYYVRMAFGEWDERGPRIIDCGARMAVRRCVHTRESSTSAMVTITPAAKEWSDVPEWMAKLDALAPDRAAGQAWLDQNPGLVSIHAVRGQDRLVGLRPEARRLASIEPDDAVPQ